MYRTYLGSNVAQPMALEFLAKLNVSEVKNRAVDESFSALVTTANSSTLYIFAELIIPWEYINIAIHDFNGTGSYVLEDAKVDFISFCGDFYYTNLTLDSSSLNLITIDEYDTVLNRCSGTFALDLYQHWNGPPLRLRHGVFSLPIVNINRMNQLPPSVVQHQQRTQGGGNR